MNTLCASDRQRYSLVAMRLMATTNAILSATAAVRSLAFLQHHAVQHGMKKRLWTTRSGSILSFSQAPGSKWSPLPFLRPSWDAQRRLRSLPSQKRLAISRSKNSGEGDNDVSSAAREAETWTTDKVRATFIEYFTNRCNHTYHPSSSCVPLNDPTLLFTNAGMNQFKSMFLGQIDPNSPLATLRRVVNSQKCIRAGGKHNDLDDVGRDTYHHTFFEMLGTWSFGDYFKKEAIDYAWEILTKVYKIDEHRLYATYFDGDDKLGLGADLEAKKYWMRYLPEERVIGCNAKDNFWEMGEAGPCGPCSEIHYDRIGNRNAAALVNADNPDVIEIWNIVFIQYNRDESGVLSTLPQMHIDTGMGLERLVSLLQHKASNYDIDVFQPLFNEIALHSQVGSYAGLVLDDDVTLRDTAYRAIADHARTLCFAIADGAVPSNVGRGYVLRRVLRRAARYGQQILKAKPGFFSTLVPVVTDTFGGSFPELVKNEGKVADIIKDEEEAFSIMLDRGINFFADLKSYLNKNKTSVVPGDKAFFLYDTLGFPLDLTEQMASEAGLTIDLVGFNTEMEEQKRRSRVARSSAKFDGAPRLELVAEHTAWLSNAGVRRTDDSLKYDWDIDPLVSIEAIFGFDGFLDNDSSATEGDAVGLILNSTPFYAEAGGQESDLGTVVIVNADGSTTSIFEVTDVQTYGGFVLHSGKVIKGEIRNGAKAKGMVDYDRRRDVAPNHTMTHVLNSALRTVLGDGVEQRGSNCNNEKLRFDFSYRRAMTVDELRRTEKILRESIRNSEPVSNKIMPLKEASAISCVRAVFGEVYPDPVRVVTVGTESSVEFCGGTHLMNTAEAEAFALVEETAVSKGIRRITGVTKAAAKRAIFEGEKFETVVSCLEKQVTQKGDVADLDKKAGLMRKELDAGYMSAPLKAELRARIEILQKKGFESKKKELSKRVDGVLKSAIERVKEASANGKPFLILDLELGTDSKASQKVLNVAKQIAPTMAIMGISEAEQGSGGNVLCFAVVPDVRVKQGLSADKWVRTTLAICGGRGGGKASSAQGQAKECSDLGAILSEASAFASAATSALAIPSHSEK